MPRFYLSKKYFVDGFAASPRLSPMNKTLRHRILSLTFQAVAYAIAGYSFFFLFFASQF